MSIEQLLKANMDAMGELTEAILTLVEQQRTSVVMTVDMDEPKPEPKQKKEKKKPVEKVVEPEPVEEAEVVEPDPIEAVDCDTLTIDEVRAKLSPLVGEHNVTIASSIKEMGKSKLSDLDPTQFGELLDKISAATGVEL